MDALPPYTRLTPDTVLNALDTLGLATTGSLLALNSYENRVFQVGVAPNVGDHHYIVAKFYRPNRWSEMQILEEHAFLAELCAAEIPAVPPMTINGATLHLIDGFRVAVFERRGGRAPNLDDPDVRIRLGRFLGRIHSVASTRAFEHRPTLDAHHFGSTSRNDVLESTHLPLECRTAYAQVTEHALEAIHHAYERAGPIDLIRLHGDVHEGNVLYTDAGPHFVDFDDSRMGPAVQDLWMLLGHGLDEQTQRLKDFLAGYEAFAPFNRRALHLIEALRTLRLMHYSAWIARRWADPAFPAAFPWFADAHYWHTHIATLREQIAAMHAPPLAA